MCDGIRRGEGSRLIFLGVVARQAIVGSDTGEVGSLHLNLRSEGLGSAGGFPSFVSKREGFGF